jgi:hypothetical protein
MFRRLIFDDAATPLSGGQNVISYPTEYSNRR